MMWNSQYIYQNGHYIPFLYPLFYYLAGSHLLTVTIVLKMLAVNYFVHFGNFLPFSSICNPILKGFMRLTDTGYIATCFFIFNPTFFPIAFNIHMLIFIGYFIAILFCGMTDADYIYLPQVDNDFASKWSYVVHLLPICFYIYYMSKNRKNIQFTTSTFKYSVYWVLIWFVFIYMPWRIFTGDVIYSILGKETTIYMKIMIVIGVLIALYSSNHIGKYICKSCK